ncbi:hypothetical protein [Saccharopolyspora spinosa]|uniref:hypothetical protein n=1 Tax=Saccharopolyspora spinosa TaxID=60894 RepID=UPI00376EACA3
MASQDAVRAEQDAVRAVYVKGNGAKAFLASGDFFGGGQAHYFLDTVQGDDRRIDPESTLPPEVIAAAVADLDWWVQQVGLRATAGAAMVVVPWRLCGVRIPQRLASFWVGLAQVAWLDGQLSSVAELLQLRESESPDRLGNLAGIAELAELAGRMEQHLKAMPPGFDPDGERAFNVEAAKRIVRQGAWTTKDLHTVEDGLPAMRQVEKIWRDLASRTGRTNNA